MSREALRRSIRIFPGSKVSWSRWYDAESGRWPSDDPIGFEGQASNLARYVGNSPVHYVDPSGLTGEYLSNPYTSEGVWRAAAGGIGNQ
jgi:uncharacterized protein RhaS with RHS repeats